MADAIQEGKENAAGEVHPDEFVEVDDVVEPVKVKVTPKKAAKRVVAVPVADEASADESSPDESSVAKTSGDETSVDETTLEEASEGKTPADEPAESKPKVEE